MHPELTIEHNYSLQRLNTFGITANAAAYVRITSQAELQAALQDPALSAMPRLILGGGSNIVLTGDFPGAVLHMATRGMRLAHLVSPRFNEQGLAESVDHHASIVLALTAGDAEAGAQALHDHLVLSERMITGDGGA